MDYKDFIRFVPAGSDHAKEVKQTKKSSHQSLTGEEAKAFYEELISGDSQSFENGSSHKAKFATNQVPERGKNTEVIKNKECRESSEETGYQLNEQATATGPHTLDEDGLELIHVKQEPIDSDMLITEKDNLCDLNERVEHIPDEKEFQRAHNKLLSYAQNGDLQELKRLINDKDLDLNFQDSFGWTALMCAAVSKHIDVIKFLLSKGANKYILNSKGQTVSELCEEMGTIDAKIAINTYNRGSTVKVRQKRSRKFFCDVCKREFLECSQNEHNSSTVHLFNLRLKPKVDRYVIPENNRGFQLMKKSGWDGEKGLGPSGQGSKYPVKTSLKRDRKCLGSDINKNAKITHFGPRDPDAVKSLHKQPERVMSARTISKRERKKREQRSKQWERNLRTYMSIDF